MKTRYKLGGEDYELVRGEVIQVNYSDENIKNLYSISVQLLNSIGSSSPEDVITARPIDPNIKHIPLIGEVVLILRGPTQHGAGIKTTSENYYVSVFSIQSNVNHNAIPKLTNINTKGAGGDYSNATAGNPDVIGNTKHELAKSFEERLVNPLQPFAGDVLYEGRMGSALRFGSTIIDTSDYSKEPKTWKRGIGKAGDPILVLSNGHGDTAKYNKFIVENIDKDDASIYFTSTQQLVFDLSPRVNASIKNQSINTYEREATKFSGAQLAMFSTGRIFLHTKDKEIILFGGGGIGFSSKKSISFDTKREFEIGNAKRINLGLNADEPILLGDTSGDWLSDFLQQMQDLCTQLSLETHISPVGPTTPPVNAPAYVNLQAQFLRLQQTIPTLKSKLAFVNKNPK